MTALAVMVLAYSLSLALAVAAAYIKGRCDGARDYRATLGYVLGRRRWIYEDGEFREDG